MSWNDARIASLKVLWADGLSASEIAAEIGGITRNAVIGKAHRLGLAGRPRNPFNIARERNEPAKRKPRRTLPLTYGPSRVATALARVAEAAPEAATPSYDTVIPLTQRVTLADLDGSNCHWPVGDPAEQDFYFCGGKALSGLPYCAHHTRIAYQPASDRRKPGPKPGGKSGRLAIGWLD